MDDKEFDLRGIPEGGSQFINTPGIYEVEINSFILSDDVDKYKGKPYIEFELVNDEEKVSKARFWRPHSEDKEESIVWKKRRLRDFLRDAGLDVEAVIGLELLKKAVGKKAKCLFREREYVGYDKENNNKPTVKTIVDFYFSVPKDSEKKYGENYFYAQLDADNQRKLDYELDDWNKKHESAPVTTEASKSDDSSGDKPPF